MKIFRRLIHEFKRKRMKRDLIKKIYSIEGNKEDKRRADYYDTATIEVLRIRLNVLKRFKIK